MAGAERERWLVELGHSRLKRARLKSDGGLGMTVAESIMAFGGWAEEHRGAEVVLAGVPSSAIVERLVRDLRDCGVSCSQVGLGAAPLPVAPAYGSLGVDRWLAFNAAWQLHRSSLCVIDAGTAVTLDLVDQAGTHCGGWILPGLEAARSGLLERAPGLERPREAATLPMSPATDTAQALERGLVLQQVGAIRLGIERAAVALGHRPTVVLTGGGAATVQSALEIDDLQPDLVLHGLALAATALS